MKLDQVIATRSNKTIYRSGDFAVKVFSEDFSKVDVLNEALNQARVEETGLNIPAVQEVLKIDGKWAIVSDYVEGKTLAQLVEEAPDKKADYVAMMVDLQILVHSKRAANLNRLREKMHRKISQANLDDATKYELQTRLESRPKHYKVCHGDFYFSNIILKPDGTPYIIDWSHVTQGNASADVARTYLLFWLAGDVAGAEMYLKLYAEKTGTAKHYVKGWLPIVAASQSVKGNEKEREFLLSWATVVDFE